MKKVGAAVNDRAKGGILPSFIAELKVELVTRALEHSVEVPVGRQAGTNFFCK